MHVEVGSVGNFGEGYTFSQFIDYRAFLQRVTFSRRKDNFKAMRKILISGLVLLGAQQATAALPSRGNSKRDIVGDIFAQIGYRPYTLARYVARTQAGKEGRRDILDWGCGGGGLSHELATRGAHKIVAVDMNSNAINSTKYALRPYPNAMARRPRATVFCGLPGQLGYTSHFDIVVSFCGALSEGTTMADRIPTTDALSQAVQACRDGGSVIIAEVALRAHRPQLLALVFASAFGWLFDASWLWNRPGWQQWGMWCLASLPFLGVSRIPVQQALILKNMARSFKLREWRPSSITFGIVWVAYFLLIEIMQNHNKLLVKRAMREAGLSNVRIRSWFWPHLRFVQPMHCKEASSKSKAMSLKCNAGVFPNGRLLIFEGVKKNVGK